MSIPLLANGDRGALRFLEKDRVSRKAEPAVLPQREPSRLGKVHDQLGERLMFVRAPCGLTWAAPPGFAKWTVVCRIEAELIVKPRDQLHRLGVVA